MMAQGISTSLYAGFPTIASIPKWKLPLSVKWGVRVPNLVVFSAELLTAMQGASRSLVTLEVVEIVSLNQEKRDYRWKRSEYAAKMDS